MNILFCELFINIIKYNLVNALYMLYNLIRKRNWEPCCWPRTLHNNNNSIYLQLFLNRKMCFVVKFRFCLFKFKMPWLCPWRTVCWWDPDRASWIRWQSPWICACYSTRYEATWWRPFSAPWWALNCSWYSMLVDLQQPLVAQSAENQLW